MVLAGERRQALRSLVPLLERGIVTEGDGDEFLSLYTKVWGGFGISLGQQFGFGPIVVNRDVPPSWVAAHTRLRHEDPSHRFLAGAPQGTPFVTSRVWNATSRRLEIYQQFVEVHGYADSIVQHFAAPKLGDLFGAVMRPRGAKPFSEDDVTIARLLHTLVAGALATRSALHALVMPGAPGPSGHAFVSFPGMRVELALASRRAWERILREPLGPRGLRRVERMLERIALDFRRGGPGARVRRLLGGVVAELAWVPPRANESHRALILFFEEGVDEGVLGPAAELLSPTQRKVAELAARGRTNVEIAATLHLSMETVRTHLREGMRRLDVARRAELARFLEHGVEAVAGGPPRRRTPD